MDKDKSKLEKEKIQYDKMKYEIAEELGLSDKINKYGWKGLTARESGKIGGIISNKNKNRSKNK